MSSLVHAPSDEAQTAAWPRAPLLLCASSSRTGPVEGLIALAVHLRAQGIDARFGGDTVRPGEDLPGHLARAGVPLVEALRLSRKVRPGDLIHDARTLTAWVREGTPDLIQCAFAHDHALALWAARRSGPARQRLRIVREAHRRVDVSPGRLGVRRRLLGASDGVIVRCEAYRDALVAQGLDPSRVAAIPGSVDQTLFTPGRTPEAHRLRARWGIPENGVLIGMVARMKPERLQTRLVDEFYRALHDSPDAHLVLVGRGEDEEALRGLAQRLAPERIRFGGYLRGPGLVDACTSTFPSTVASTGPASTGRAAALAVNWFSNLFCEPPPTMCSTSILVPVSSSRPSSVAAYLSARLSKTQRANCPSVSGTG